MNTHVTPQHRPELTKDLTSEQGNMECSNTYQLIDLCKQLEFYTEKGPVMSADDRVAVSAIRAEMAKLLAAERGIPTSKQPLLPTPPQSRLTLTAPPPQITPNNPFTLTKNGARQPTLTFTPALPLSNQFTAISDTSDMDSDTTIVDQATDITQTQRPQKRKTNTQRTQHKNTPATSPTQAAKKVAVDPNEFPSLPSTSTESTITTPVQTESDNMDTSKGGDFKFQDDKPPRIPPIVIDDSRLNWRTLQDMFKNHGIPLNTQTGTTAKLTGTHTFTVKVPDADTHRKLTKILDDPTLANPPVKYHTYILPTDKNIKAVIRQLPIDTNVVDIQTALIEEGFTVTNVTQLTSRRNGDRVTIPLFLVTLPKSDKSKEIYHIPYILHLKVFVEPYKGRRGPSQCHRCQKFFHGARSCRHPPRCVKCAGEHLTSECKKTPEETPKCALCNGEHTANWRGCPRHPVIEPKANQPQTPHNPITTQRPTLYNTRTIIGKSYASNLHSEQTQDSLKILEKANEVLDRLSTMVRWIQESRLLEALETFQRINTFHNLPPANLVSSQTPNHE